VYIFEVTVKRVKINLCTER